MPSNIAGLKHACGMLLIMDLVIDSLMGLLMLLSTLASSCAAWSGSPAWSGRPHTSHLSLTNTSPSPQEQFLSICSLPQQQGPGPMFPRIFFCTEQIEICLSADLSIGLF